MWYKIGGSAQWAGGTSALLDLAVVSIWLRFPPTPCPVLQYIAACVSRGMRFGVVPGIPRQHACASIGVDSWRSVPGRMPSGRMRHRRCLPKKSAVSPNWRRCVQAKIGTDVQPVVWFRDVGDREMDFHDMIDPGIHIYGSLVAFFPGIRSSKQDRRRLLARFLGLKPHTVQVLSILSIMPASVLFSRAAATRSLSDSCLDTSPSWACEPSLMRTSTR